MLKERARILNLFVFATDLGLVATAFFLAFWLRDGLFPALGLVRGRLYPLGSYLPLLGLKPL